MSDAVVSDTVRLTLSAPGRRADVVVPASALVGDVARDYAESTGLTSLPSLTTTTGRALDERRTLRQCGVASGDVVVMTPARKDTAAATDEGSSPGAVGGAVDRRRVRRSAGWLVAVCVVVASLAGAFAGAGPLRTGSAGLLLLTAVVAALPWPFGGSATLWRGVAPVFAAGGVFVAVDRSAPGGLLLAVAVAALAAAVVAALARALDRLDDHEVTVVWVSAAGVVAVSAVAMLLLGAPPRSLWAVLFALAVVVARWLPYQSVDVPDQALLDLDRLAITAWSARERPRSGRRRNVVRPESVATLVRRGHRLLSAGVVSVTVAMAVTGPALVLSPDDDTITGIGTQLLVLLGGAAVALVSRSYRARRPRVVLRGCGAWVLGFLAAAHVFAADAASSWWLATAAVLVAVPTVMAGVALGRGWRSIWWGRTGDIVEGTCVVFAVAALPVASGLFAFVRQLTS